MEQIIIGALIVAIAFFLFILPLPRPQKKKPKSAEEELIEAIERFHNLKKR